MKTLKFRYVGAWNFLPFGPDGVEIYFDDYGQVVLITGENLDTGTANNPASNGSGKSSIQDIISYALYGQTVKRPKKLNHEDIINKTTKEKLLVDVQFDDYRIVRGREPNKLDIWYSKDHIWDKTTRITKGSGNQETIDHIIGLSHTAFCGVVVFDDSNTYSFLELDAAGKRQVAENLLGLDRYRSDQESAKAVVKEHKLKIRDLTKDYENLRQSIGEADARIVRVEEQQKTWVRSKRSEISLLFEKLAGRQRILASCDGGTALANYEASRHRAAELALSVEDFKVKKEKNVSEQKEARPKLREFRDGLTILESTLQKHRLECQRLQSGMTEARKKIADLTNLQDGTTCPTCHGKVSKDNYASLLLHQQNVLTTSEAKYEKEEAHIVETTEKVKKRISFINRVEELIKSLEKKEAYNDSRIKIETQEINQLLEIPKPEVGELERSLEAEIVAIKKQIEEKQDEIDGISPYKEILEHAELERQKKIAENKVKAKELEEAEKLLPYRTWWVDAFGEAGIRKHLVQKVIPALNCRVAYWLQYLIDSKIQLTFDCELVESITINGVDAYYHAMSNGEKRRINLAVSQAFAHVMMLDSGHCPSIIFLDEVTGGGIDTAGVTGIYNMIYELAKARQVFVTTHNQALLHMLDGCESIKLIKKGDITSLVK